MGEGRRSVLATMMVLIDEHEHVVQLSHQTCDICALIGFQSASYGGLGSSYKTVFRQWQYRIHDISGSFCPNLMIHISFESQEAQ